MIFGIMNCVLTKTRSITLTFGIMNCLSQGTTAYYTCLSHKQPYMHVLGKTLSWHDKNGTTWG
jgi:hypothetical protein